MKNIGIILCCLAFWQCNQQKAKMPEFALDKNLAVIVDSFIKANPGQKVYEIYIDKIVVDSTIIMLYAGNFSCTSQENAHFKQLPVVQVILNNISIDVYSGMERYVKNLHMIYDSSKMELTKGLIGGAGCVIFDNNGKLRVDKKYSQHPNYPFISLPALTINDLLSLPPDMTKDSIETD